MTGGGTAEGEKVPAARSQHRRALFQWQLDFEVCNEFELTYDITLRKQWRVK
jgi:hypothetical protein